MNIFRDFLNSLDRLAGVVRVVESFNKDLHLRAFSLECKAVICLQYKYASQDVGQNITPFIYMLLSHRPEYYINEV